MRAKSVWSRDTTYSFPVYRATVNGHAMSVWRNGQGDWAYGVTVDRTKDVTLNSASSLAKAKRWAAEWAAEHDAPLVRVMRGKVMGYPAWVLDVDLMNALVRHVMGALAPGRTG